MSKRLGRGLSSLFAVYDDDKNNKKSKHFDDDNTQKNINKILLIQTILIIKLMKNLKILQ